jgi:hypothetical protein
MLKQMLLWFSGFLAGVFAGFLIMVDYLSRLFPGSEFLHDSMILVQMGLVLLLFASLLYWRQTKIK